MNGLKTILVATDFGEASNEALAYGRELARTLGASLHVLHVVENVTAQFVTEIAAIEDYPDLQPNAEAAARQQMEKKVTDEDRRSLRARLVLRTSTSPAAAIVKYANQEDVDLIVVGTHGRGALGRFFMGSVADRVVRTASCPVLTVHASERDALAPDAAVA